MEQPAKREVPSALKTVLEVDVRLSKEVVEWVNGRWPIVDMRTHLKTLEVASSRA